MGNMGTAAGAVENVAVVKAMNFIINHVTQGKWRMTMRTAVFQRHRLTRLGLVKHHRHATNDATHGLGADLIF